MTGLDEVALGGGFVGGCRDRSAVQLWQRALSHHLLHIGCPDLLPFSPIRYLQATPFNLHALLFRRVLCTTLSYRGQGRPPDMTVNNDAVKVEDLDIDICGVCHRYEHSLQICTSSCV